MEFGFPLGYLDDDSVLVDVNKNNLQKYKNHQGGGGGGAEDFTDDMLSYLKKECQQTAIWDHLKLILSILALKLPL